MPSNFCFPGSWYKQIFSEDHFPLEAAEQQGARVLLIGGAPTRLRNAHPCAAVLYV